MKIISIFPSFFCALFILNACQSNIVKTDPKPSEVVRIDTVTTKKDTIVDVVKPDIESLYFLRDDTNYPKHLVSYYETKNTEDTHYMEDYGEMSFKPVYSPSGELIKFENPWMDGDFNYNEYGLPTRKYNNNNYPVMELFYNEKKSLIKVLEYFQYDKSFLREFRYDYDANNKLKAFTMNESSLVINNKFTLNVYPNLVIGKNFRKELNAQQLVVNLNNQEVLYSVENNILTVKLLNKDGSVYTYYTLSFDKHYKPIIPSYFEIYPKDYYYEDMIISSLLNYTHRNPLKITRVDMVMNEFKEVYNINYTYKYNAKGLPTEIFKAKEMKNYLNGGSSGYSKQLIKIDYQ